jgi:hypothetical protein
MRPRGGAIMVCTEVVDHPVANHSSGLLKLPGYMPDLLRELVNFVFEAASAACSWLSDHSPGDTRTLSCPVLASPGREFWQVNLSLMNCSRNRNGK